MGDLWLFITAAILIIGLVLHQVPLLLISLLFFLGGGLSRLWNRYSLVRIEYQRRLSTNRVFFGEEVQFEVEVANRKPLPLPWIRIDDEFPNDIMIPKGTTLPYSVTRNLLTHFLHLSWYHKVKWRYTLQCLQRGYFAFGPAHIRSGDPFGFFSQEMDTQPVDYLMVYPKMVPLDRLGIPSNQLFGNIRLKRCLFQDPVLTMGVRDYHFGDSIRQVHWKTTARLGRLHTRIFESTTTMDMAIFFDVSTVVPPSWHDMPELLELGIMATASICRHALDKGYQTGLFVNQTAWSSPGLIRILPSQKSDQLLHILEALARLQSPVTVSTSIADLVLRQSSNLSWWTTLTVITAVPTAALISALARMKKFGRMVMLIVTGDSELPILQDTVPVFRIPCDKPWREIDMLSVGVS